MPCIRLNFLAPFMIVTCLICVLIRGTQCNPDAKRLYDDLISRYNKLVRPVTNVSEPLTVHIKLKLSQLIEVNLKNQIMTTNLWVEQYWHDYKLTWDPREYGGVDMLHVPSDHIWRPDIVLYNNADGNFEVTLATKAILNSKGFIQWKPPAIYKSSCEIDVEYFPFDEQTCVMKFGSWTYDGYKVDLRHRDEVSNTNIIDIGIDLTEFYLSVEWDILEVPAIRNEKFYTCCVEPYIDITFNISMRRKTLFYTVNLIIPCMGISFLTVLVFYLPSDSGEKVALSISIFLSLTVFFLLLVEIIPPTSLVVPLLGKYLLFTMILVSLSIAVTVVVLNVHFRSSATHRMAPWVKRVFIHMLPRLLLMKRPPYAPSVTKVAAVVKAASPYVHQAHHHSSTPYFPNHRDNMEPPVEKAAPQRPEEKTPSKRTTYKQVVRTCNGTELRDFAGQAGSPAEPVAPLPPLPPPLLLPSPGSPYDHRQHSANARGSSFGEQDGGGLAGFEVPFPEPTLLNASPNCRVHGPGAASRHGSGHFPVAPQLEEHLIIRERAGRPGSADNGGDGLGGDGRTSPPGNIRRIHFCPEFLKAMENVQFIADHTRESNKDIDEDWKYVAMVLDRLFLWIFTVAVLVGTCGIILHAPTLYDDRQPIDVKLSEVALAILNARRQG